MVDKRKDKPNVVVFLNGSEVKGHLTNRSYEQYEILASCGVRGMLSHVI